MSMISVIVPVYNVEPYLQEAVQSLIHQTYSDLEIILVDDGSTDGSGRICDEYLKQDSRVKVIHQDNRGLSGARNAGLDVCNGEMIAFLDPDDVFCRDMLRIMSEVMQKNRCDIVECNYTLVKGRRAIDHEKAKRNHGCIAPGIKREGLYQKKEALHMQIDGKLAANVWNKLYKRGIWRELRFREGRNFEDFDMILSIIGEAENMYVLDDSLIMHRIRDGSITETRTLQNLKDRMLTYEHYMEYVQVHTPHYFDEKDLNMIRGRLYKLLMAEYFTCACKERNAGNQYLNELKAIINDAENRINIKESGFKARASSFLYHNAPTLVSGLAYKIYREFRFLR